MSKLYHLYSTALESEAVKLRQRLAEIDRLLEAAKKEDKEEEETGEDLPARPSG